MKFASFRYDCSGNLGDEIQSLAAEQFLPRVDKKFDRDTLASLTESEKYLVIMNGWFSEFPDKCFPPSDVISPVFIGFHLSDSKDSHKRFLSPKSVDYFKRHEPIGCQDKKTMETLASKSVKTFYSKCLTLTFPKRDGAPKNGNIFVVDAAHIPIAEFLHEQAIFLTHKINDAYGDELKSLLAKRLLELYRDEASLVITTRLHCALPCLAMGVPFIFFGDSSDYRISPLADLNVKIHRPPNKLFGKFYQVTKNFFWGKIIRSLYVKIFYRDVQWNPQAICIEKEKGELIKTAQDLLKSAIGSSS